MKRIFLTRLSWSVSNAEALRSKLKKELGYKVYTDVYSERDDYLISISFDKEIDEVAFKLKFGSAQDLNEWLLLVWDK